MDFCIDRCEYKRMVYLDIAYLIYGPFKGLMTVYFEIQNEGSRATNIYLAKKQFIDDDGKVAEIKLEYFLGHFLAAKENILPLHIKIFYSLI